MNCAQNVQIRFFFHFEISCVFGRAAGGDINATTFHFRKIYEKNFQLGRLTSYPQFHWRYGGSSVNYEAIYTTHFTWMRFVGWRPMASRGSNINETMFDTCNPIAIARSYCEKHGWFMLKWGLNMFQITIRSITLVVLLGVLAACAGNTPYRGNIQTTCIAHQEMDCTDSALQHHAPQQSNEYYLGFVEYDDQGQLRDRKQLQAVLDGLYPIAGTQDVLIVVFVHGWQHNASPGDANVAAFRQLLTKLARVEHDRKNGRKVLGIYLGWRGESVTVPGLKQLTFWERKNTAHEVGQQGITEVLLKLEEIVNVKAGMEESVPKPINSRLVVIGHSFGGAVVYAALQQVLTDRFIDSRSGKTHAGGAQGFGDLVVLVNPAFEALRYAPLYDLSQERCRSFSGQLPLFAILTSENDLATKYAFPTGRAFSTLFEAHNTLIRNTCSELGKEVEQLIDEGTADRQAVGHFEPYLSHRLNPASSQPRPRRASAADFRQLKALWSKQSFGGKIPFEGSELVHLGKTQPLNPYLNIQVEKTLIADHNDIWGDQVLNFVRDLILVATLPESTAQPDESGIDGPARTIK